MKCVHFAGYIHRVDDDTAAMLVKQGHEYCPKRIWKQGALTENKGVRIMSDAHRWHYYTNHRR
jgi:hypothetical protein